MDAAAKPAMDVAVTEVALSNLDEGNGGEDDGHTRMDDYLGKRHGSISAVLIKNGFNSDIYGGNGRGGSGGNGSD